MGFRDLICFNKALLAKQCWRLLKSPDSLVARIIKAKYYSNGSLMMAKLGSKPSFAWRSIFGARELLEEGLMWRIGNGKNVKIWGDKWIPKPISYTAHSAPRMLDPDSKVSDLINWEAGGWNHNLLGALFSEEEKEAIYTVPICSINQPDIQIWRGTTSGEFSVRSAYHLGKEIEKRNEPESSNKVKENAVWKILWNMDVPNAEKNFFWRACNNLLPTKENLMKKRVVSEPWCPICEREPESVIHVLWECSAAKDVWGDNDRCFQKRTTEYNSFLQLAESMMVQCGLNERASFVRMARKLWQRRNAWVHENRFGHPASIIQEVRRAMEEYKLFNKREDHVHQREDITTLTGWKVPPAGWWKANWDVAIGKNSGRVGVGVVVRDSEGQIIVARSLTRLGRLDPTTGEALAAHYAVCLCQEMGAVSLILEGDAKQVVEAINSKTSNGSRYGHFVNDTCRILQEKVSQWKCVFVPREANQAAHRLAKAATTDIIDKIWRYEIPDCICDVLPMES
jgi:ribonuclease HI